MVEAAAPTRPRLGRYELLSSLATGGMAEIFVACAHGIAGFNKLVALKRILPHLARDQEFVDMFLDEARLAASLHHPNVAQVYDIGYEDGSYFFTMEYVRGRNLRQIVKASRGSRHGLPRGHMIAIIRAVCAGLHYAHTKTDPNGKPLNLIHRDVSPSNVVVTYDGCPKVIDFGVAKALNRQTETRTGLVKGKISYMSPEQCRGDELDARSDVFALGIMLYELTTRRRLFKAANDFATIRAVTEAMVTAPSSVCPDYPAELERIVLKALAKSPDDRYATAEDLELDLSHYARQHDEWVSAVELGRYMRALFPDEATASEANEYEGGSLDFARTNPTRLVGPRKPLPDEERTDSKRRPIDEVRTLTPMWSRGLLDDTGIRRVAARGGGFVLVVGLAVFIGWLVRGSAAPADEGTGDAPPAGSDVVPASAPESTPAPTPAEPPAVAAGPGVEPRDVEPPSTARRGAVAEGAGASVDEAVPPQAVDPGPAQPKPKPTRQTATKRPKPSSPAPKRPKKPKKPKWDPNSALLPPG